MYTAAKLTMREALLEILADPGTGSPLRFDAKRAENGNVLEGELTSDQSGRTYRRHPLIAPLRPET